MWESVWFMWFRHAPIYHMLGRHMTAPNGWQFGTTIDSSWHSPHIGLEIPCEVQNLPVGQAHVASHLDAWATDIVWYRPTEFRSSLFRPEIPAGQKDITKSKSNLSKSAVPNCWRPKVLVLPLFRSKNWRASRLSAWPAGYGCWPQGLSVGTTTETNGQTPKSKPQGSELPGTFGSHGTCYVYCYQLFLMLLLILVLLLFHC